MAEVAVHEGATVVFTDVQGNREKGLVGARGKIVRVVDYVLHIQMDDAYNNSILPSGLQYPTRNQVEVIEGAQD